MLNDDEIDLESGSMKLKPNMPNELKYCVKGLLKHTLTVQINGKITNSALDCVETALSTEDRTFVSLGYDELEGDCKQAYRHLFVLKNGKNSRFNVFLLCVCVFSIGCFVCSCQVIIFSFEKNV